MRWGALIGVLLAPLLLVATSASVVKVHVVPHSHTDPGWLSTYDDYYSEVERILNTVAIALRKDRSRTFVWSEISFFSKWWVSQKEFRQSEFREWVNQGRFEFVGGGWIMPDEAIAYHENVVTAIKEGHEWVWKTFGVTPKVGWQIDAFGHSRAIARLYAQAGIKFMILNRIPYYLKGKGKELQFWWNVRNSQDALTYVLDHSDDDALSMDQLHKNNVGRARLFDPPKQTQHNDDTPRANTKNDNNDSAWVFGHVLYSHYSRPDALKICDVPTRLEKEQLESAASRLVEQLQEQIQTYQLTDPSRDDTMKYSDGHHLKHLLLPFGDDFQFQVAPLQFICMDRIISAINQRVSQYGIELFYSTPSRYFAALASTIVQERYEIPLPPMRTDMDQNEWSMDGNIAASVKNALTHGSFRHLFGDLMPYANNAVTYWTGYYSTQPSLKALFRKTLSSVRAAEIALNLFTLSKSSKLGGRSSTDKTLLPFFLAKKQELYQAKSSSLLLVHHDAITGTSLPHVMDDYMNRAFQALHTSHDIIAQIMSHILAKDSRHTSSSEINPSTRIASFPPVFAADTTTPSYFDPLASNITFCSNHDVARRVRKQRRQQPYSSPTTAYQACEFPEPVVDTEYPREQHADTLPIPLIYFNSQGWWRRETVSIRVTEGWKNAGVVDGLQQPVISQIVPDYPNPFDDAEVDWKSSSSPSASEVPSPLSSEPPLTRDIFVASSNFYCPKTWRLYFTIEVPPLGSATYHVYTYRSDHNKLLQKIPHALAYSSDITLYHSDPVSTKTGACNYFPTVQYPLSKAEIDNVHPIIISNNAMDLRFCLNTATNIVSACSVRSKHNREIATGQSLSFFEEAHELHDNKWSRLEVSLGFYHADLSGTYILRTGQGDDLGIGFAIALGPLLIVFILLLCLVPRCFRRKLSVSPPSSSSSVSANPPDASISQSTCKHCIVCLSNPLYSDRRRRTSANRSSQFSTLLPTSQRIDGSSSKFHSICCCLTKFRRCYSPLDFPWSKHGCSTSQLVAIQIISLLMFPFLFIFGTSVVIVGIRLESRGGFSFGITASLALALVLICFHCIRSKYRRGGWLPILTAQVFIFLLGACYGFFFLPFHHASQLLSTQSATIVVKGPLIQEVTLFTDIETDLSIPSPQYYSHTPPPKGMFRDQIDEWRKTQSKSKDAQAEKEKQFRLENRQQYLQQTTRIFEDIDEDHGHMATSRPADYIEMTQTVRAGTSQEIFLRLVTDVPNQGRVHTDSGLSMVPWEWWSLQASVISGNVFPMQSRAELRANIRHTASKSFGPRLATWKRPAPTSEGRSEDGAKSVQRSYLPDQKSALREVFSTLSNDQQDLGKKKKRTGILPDFFLTAPSSGSDLLSVISSQSMGVASLQDGSLDLFLHRRPNRDDGQGLGVAPDDASYSHTRLLVRLSDLADDGALYFTQQRNQQISTALNHPLIALHGQFQQPGSTEPVNQQEDLRHGNNVPEKDDLDDVNLSLEASPRNVTVHQNPEASCCRHWNNEFFTSYSVLHAQTVADMDSEADDLLATVQSAAEVLAKSSIIRQQSGKLSKVPELPYWMHINSFTPLPKSYIASLLAASSSNSLPLVPKVIEPRLNTLFQMTLSLSDLNHATVEQVFSLDHDSDQTEASTTIFQTSNILSIVEDLLFAPSKCSIVGTSYLLSPSSNNVLLGTATLKSAATLQDLAPYQIQNILRRDVQSIALIPDCDLSGQSILDATEKETSKNIILASKSNTEESIDTDIERSAPLTHAFYQTPLPTDMIYYRDIRARHVDAGKRHPFEDYQPAVGASSSLNSKRTHSDSSAARVSSLLTYTPQVMNTRALSAMFFVITMTCIMVYKYYGRFLTCPRNCLRHADAKTN